MERLGILILIPLAVAFRHGHSLRGEQVPTAQAPSPPSIPTAIGPPLPPPCPVKPVGPDTRAATAGDFKPPDAEAEVHLKNGGTAFQLKGGGWMYRYPKVAIRQEGNKTRLDFAEPPYTVEYGPESTVL